MEKTDSVEGGRNKGSRCGEWIPVDFGENGEETGWWWVELDLGNLIGRIWI
jgi:hypothetical protein